MAGPHPDPDTSYENPTGLHGSLDVNLKETSKMRQDRTLLTANNCPFKTSLQYRFKRKAKIKHQIQWANDTVVVYNRFQESTPIRPACCSEIPQEVAVVASVE